MLVIPFDDHCGLRVAVLRRADMDAWQFVAGGGEEGETPLAAARREAREEIGAGGELYPLDTCCSVPASVIRREVRSHWSARTLVIPEYAFALRVKADGLTLSHEHSSAVWASPEEAAHMLRYDSNRTALSELTERIRRGWLDMAQDIP
ncbi:MAG: NUDIX domain-containing protein [Aristaeellaceae bacterium]